MGETVEETLPPLSVCRLAAALGPEELATLLGWRYRWEGLTHPSLDVPRTRRYKMKTRQAVNSFLSSVGCPPHPKEMDRKKPEFKIYNSYWLEDASYQLYLADGKP